MGAGLEGVGEEEGALDAAPLCRERAVPDGRAHQSGRLREGLGGGVGEGEAQGQYRDREGQTQAVVLAEQPALLAQQALRVRGDSSWLLVGSLVVDGAR